MAEKVIIVGGGLAGLSCALVLNEAGLDFKLLEASDATGGRVRTDILDGYLLDRGFQIFLTAYPEARRILDYKALDLKPFYPGALVRFQGRFHKLTDPWKRPVDGMKTFFSPIGKPADKLRIATVRARAQMMSVDEIMSQADTTTDAYLKQLGFTEEMRTRFLKPFFSGIFLERELTTSKQIFDFVFRMLSLGKNALPAKGMQEIPRQLVSKIPDDKILLKTPVNKVAPGRVHLVDGEVLNSNHIVMAVEETASRKLLGMSAPANYNSVTTVYFTADRAPVDEAIIIVNGEDTGLLTNVSVQSNVSSHYAPEGKSLIACSVVGDPGLNDSKLEIKLRTQLTGWFGAQVKSWQLLRIYRVKNSLPDQSPFAKEERRQLLETVPDGITVTGDFVENGSINGAMVAGRKAAEKVLANLSVTA